MTKIFFSLFLFLACIYHSSYSLQLISITTTETGISLSFTEFPKYDEIGVPYPYASKIRVEPLSTTPMSDPLTIERVFVDNNELFLSVNKNLFELGEKRYKVVLGPFKFQMRNKDSVLVNKVVYDSTITIEISNKIIDEPTQIKKDKSHLSTFKNHLYIQSSFPINTINILSLTGHIVKQESLINSTEFEFSTADLPKGIYFIRIEYSDSSFETIKIYIH